MKMPPVIIVQLVHITGPFKGNIQEFSEGVVTIGRHPSCQLQFPTELTTISRKHAEIVRDGNQFKLIDHSTNGTLVNGKRVKETWLRDGDVLTFTEGGPKVSFLTQVKEGTAEPPVAPVLERPQPQPLPERVPEPIPQPPLPEKVEAVSVERVRAQLVILYGPSIRTFEELPVTVGRGGRADFILDHPAILDQHAQFFFQQNRYFVKDLTGQGSVRINGRSVVNQAPLNAGDELALAPGGPFFRFIGEGRLAEITEPALPDVPDTGESVPHEKPDTTKEPGGLLSQLRKKIMPR